MTALTNITVAGQTVTVRGTVEEVDATLAQRTLTQDDGVRRLVDADGEVVRLNTAAVALVQAAKGRDERGAFGFARALEAA